MPAHPAPSGRGGAAGAGESRRCLMSARRPVVLLRPVPGTSPIHELWAGTKLTVVFGISVLLTFYPGWVPIGLVAALMLSAAWMARIPRGALPSLPRWLWVLVAIGGITAALGGG